MYRYFDIFYDHLFQASHPQLQMNTDTFCIVREIIDNLKLVSVRPANVSTLIQSMNTAGMNEVRQCRLRLKCGIFRTRWSGQVWGHTPEQRVAASTLRLYSLGLRLAIAQADVRPAMPVSFR